VRFAREVAGEQDLAARIREGRFAQVACGVDVAELGSLPLLAPTSTMRAFSLREYRRLGPFGSEEWRVAVRKRRDLSCRRREHAVPVMSGRDQEMQR
jgi:hypothetical protein